jgi:hypothetical protein
VLADSSVKPLATFWWSDRRPMPVAETSDSSLNGVTWVILFSLPSRMRMSTQAIRIASGEAIPLSRLPVDTAYTAKWR